LVVGGGLFVEADVTLKGGTSGIVAEFQERLNALRTGNLTADISLISPPMVNYLDENRIVSYLGMEMCREAGVHLLLSTYATDPIIDGRRVSGLFIEGKSGRVAIPARVVIDATGDAEIAARAGAPMIEHVPPAEEYAPMIRPKWLKKEEAYHNSVGILCVMGNVDEKGFSKFADPSAPVDEDDLQWAKRNSIKLPPGFLRAVRSSLERGNCPRLSRQIAVAGASYPGNIRFYEGGVVSFWLEGSGEIDTNDMEQISAWERELRIGAFLWSRCLRECAPGFDSAYLLFTSPYMGARGGPCIEGEHVLTPRESFDGARFDDVLFRNIHEGLHGGDESGYDVPYSILLPKKYEGLLVAGRGASYIRRGHDPSGIRARPSLMALGEAAGTAAALIVEAKVGTKSLDVKKLQKRLLERGYFLGEKNRLDELGLA
jgi:hypothetical protein